MSDPADRAIQYVLITRNELAEKVKKVGFKAAMGLRYDMQLILAKASQTGSQAGRIPMHLQLDLIERIMWIEKWCRLFYLLTRMKEIIVSEPESTNAQRKRIARAEWENTVLPQYSY